MRLHGKDDAMQCTLLRRAGRARALPALVLLLLILLCAPCTAEGTVTVCILDSGCNGDHGLGACFLTDADGLADPIGHGTQICALVQKTAPGANIVMLRCFADWDTLEEDAIVAALYAAVDTYHADVINMSWTLTDESDALHAAVRYAHEQGAVLVASCGNLSLNTALGTVAYPAAWKEVIGIAGVDLSTDGTPQTSLWYLYGETVDFCVRGDCDGEKGSSYAAARASGMIAAALQQGVEKAAIPDYLAAQAQDMGEPGYDSRFGWGYLAIP